MSRIVGFIPNRNFWIVFAVMFTLFVFVVPTFAQDVPSGTSSVFAPPNPADVWQTVLTGLLAVFASAIASPLTAPLVSLAKRLPWFGDVDPVTGVARFSGDQFNLGIAGLLSLIMWGAVALGFGSQADTVFKLVYAVLPILLGVGGNFVSNQAVYKYGVKKNIPVLGYARTPTVA